MGKANEFEHGPDAETRAGTQNFVSFPVEANLHYRFSSAEALLEDPETLAAMIRDHNDVQVPRLAVLDDYAKARNQNILWNQRRKEPEKADHRAAHNFAKVLCRFDVGYNTGNPIQVQIDKTTEQKAINEFNQDNDLDGLISEIWLDLDKFGRAYTIQYRNQEDEDVIRLSNVFETFVVYDTTIERNPIVAVRYPKTRFSKDADKTYVQPTVYTENETVYFEETTLETFKLIEDHREKHNFKEVPITEFSPDRFRLGLYEDVLPLIDLYDAGQSDTANYMTDLNDALLVISGDIEAAGLTTEDAIAQKNANMLLLESGTDINGNKTSVTAGYIYKQYDVTGVEAYKDRIHKDIHEISMVPDLTDENFSGTQSGEAMKYKLFGFKQMTDTKQRMFKKSLVRIYRLLFNLKSDVTELTNADLKGLRVIFTPNMPQAVLEELKALIDSGAQLSQETMLGLASFIEDAPSEIKRVKEEEAENPAPPLFDQQKNKTEDPEDDEEGLNEK